MTVSKPAMSHFSETAIKEIAHKITNKLNQDLPKLELFTNNNFYLWQRIRQLVFDLNNVSFEKGDYERQSLVQKFTQDISNIIPAIAPEDAKLGWRIYRQFKDELDKKPLTKERFEKELNEQK
jgi:hypothetical protein